MRPSGHSLKEFTGPDQKFAACFCFFQKRLSDEEGQRSPISHDKPSCPCLTTAINNEILLTDNNVFINSTVKFWNY